jgi:hypothetical protein
LLDATAVMVLGCALVVCASMRRVVVVDLVVRFGCRSLRRSG